MSRTIEERLNYHAYCVGLLWKGQKVNQSKLEVLADGPGHYCFKETILNPYSFDDYRKDQALFQKKEAQRKEYQSLSLWRKVKYRLGFKEGGVSE